MKVIFMGTPEFAVPVLEALGAAGHEVVAVYCQPPRPAGRGKKSRASPVQVRAEALGLPVCHPVSLKGEVQQADFAGFAADVAVVVAYGLILPVAILQAPVYGALNVHASLLPRWRGAAPVQRAIMAGDARTGVCIMQMDAGLDTGAVLMRRVTEIGVEETSGDLQARLSGSGAGLIVEALARIGELRAEPQDEQGASYAAKIDKAEARINWGRPAIEVDRLIRGLSPVPGAWCEVARERVKLLRSRVVRGQGAAGQVLRGFTVACGDGAVEIVQAQRSGKRAVSADELLRGLELGGQLD
ncbi:MAG: methionyl-tRNA formyltransferase [Paracoccaceae bacterium]